jgi:hypothetical protein
VVIAFFVFQDELYGLAVAQALQKQINKSRISFYDTFLLLHTNSLQSGLHLTEILKKNCGRLTTSDVLLGSIHPYLTAEAMM